MHIIVANDVPLKELNFYPSTHHLFVCDRELHNLIWCNFFGSITQSLKKEKPLNIVTATSKLGENSTRMVELCHTCYFLLIIGKN